MDYHIILVMACVAGISGGPARMRYESSPPTTCSQRCTASSKFSYAPGTSYEYKYEVITKTSMLGASEDHTTIGITAIAIVDVHSKCEFVMQLRDVSISAFDSKQYKDQDQDKKFAEALEKYPLRFSFQDGIIESVCPVEDDASWAVNIKKGILSTFQNSMDSFETSYSGSESDVIGKCDTEYKVTHQAWRSLTIKKKKDTSGCTHRQGYDTAIQTTPFRVSSGLKSLPILKSSHECDQEVKTTGTLLSTLCTEMHVFHPFSKDNNGATTESTQKLNFIRESQQVTTETAQGGTPQPLHFEHTKGKSQVDLKAQKALHLLKDMCKQTAKEIKPDTPRQFSTLVFTMKRIDFSGLRRIYNQVRKPEFCAKNAERVRKFVMDAIPMVGTEASVELMKTLVSNNDVTGTEADMWLASLAFVQHPTKEMINQVQQLIGLPSLSTKVLLPLSTMVHSYCRENPLCEDVAEVRNFLDTLEQNIKHGCTVTQQNFRNIMMTLRALGNTGRAQAFIPSIYKCVETQDNPMDIRVAAVQAFRRISCAADRNNLMGIVRDVDEDSELRIAAYLAVMKCPSPEFVSQIKQTLASEKVNQVGGFIWSHLTNLMESSDPANKYVQRLLNDDVLDKEFDLDKMKYSRNYEGSVFIDRINAGAKVDSNVVWSSKSFVPRSATLNLTFNLFGEAMNLFELGGRVEGLESLLESYFGPAGYYNNDKKGSNDIPLADPKVARLSPNKLNSIYNKAQTKMSEVRGAMYMRMFGNELSYNMLGTNNGINDDFSGSDMFNFLQNLRNNKPQDVSITKSFMFLDSTYTVPTIGGLPLNLTVNGTATVALDAGGKVDFKNPKSSIVIEGNFEPSGAVEIDTMMSVDAFITRGGLKMVSTLHTSTGAKGRLELTNGNVFDMSFDLTKEKSEVLAVNTAFFMVYDELETEQRMISKSRNEKSMCSSSKMERVTGLQFCTSLSTPNSSASDAPSFPLTGPLSISVAVHKKDLPSGYKIEAKTIKTPVLTLFRFLSDTPGSQNDRAIGLDMNLQHKEGILDVNLVSPWKKAVLKGELIDTASMKGLTGNINVDDSKRVYNLNAKIMIDRTKDRMTYTPTVSLQIPDWKNVELTGVLNYKLKHSFDADLLITGATDYPIMFNTSILNTPQQVGVQASLKYEEGERYMFEALSKRKIEKRKLNNKHTYVPRVYIRTPTEEIAELTGNVVYVGDKSLKATALIDKITKKPITLYVDMTKMANTKKKRVKYNGRINIQGPAVSSKMAFAFDNRDWKNIFNKIRWDYSFGKNIKDTVILNNKVKMNIFNIKKIVKITSNLDWKKNNDRDGSLSMAFNQNKVSTNMNFAIKYGKNIKVKSTKERIDLSLEAIHKVYPAKTQVNYTVEFKYPLKNIDVTVTGGHMHNRVSVSDEITVKYHPEREIALGYHLQNRSNEYLNYAGQMFLRLPQGREMSFAGAFGRENEGKYISNIEFEIIKGRRTRIDTVLKIVTEKAYEVEIGVKLPDLEPVRVIGGFTRDDHGFTAEASFSKGEKLYKLLTEANLVERKAGKFLLDVAVPSRRVNFVIEGSRYNTERHAMIDVKWDADNNIDDRFLTNVTYDFKDWDDFEVASTLHYPSQTIVFNMKHSAAARYITNIELSWSPKRQLELNIIFRDDVIDGSQRNELSVVFNSPFEGYEELGLAVSLLRDSAFYRTKSSVTWAKKKKILVSATTKVPFKLTNVDIVGSIETPFKQYENMLALVKHSFGDELKTKMLVQWGRQKLSLDVDGKLQFTKTLRSFDSELVLRTPFEGLRIFMFNAHHNDDYRKYSSRLSVDMSQFYNQTQLSKYLIEMDVTHDRTKMILNNQGTLQITIPNDDISTMWEITQREGSTHAMLDVVPQRGNRFKVGFDETHQLRPNRKFTSSFDLIIPTEEVKELFIKFSHEDKSGFVKMAGSITKDSVNQYSSNVYYYQHTGSVEFNSKIQSAYYDDISLELTSSHSLMPYRGKLDFKWAENQKITVETSLFHSDYGRFESSVKLSTPFERARKVKLVSKRVRSGLSWDSMIELNFAPKQKISFGAVYRFDHIKLTSITFKTPFPQFPGLQTSFKLDGSPINLRGEADFTMQPYVGKTSVDFNWAYYEGTSLTGAFNLNTPFRQYPYMKIKVNSNSLGISRVSNVEVEYLPTQVVKIETDYRFTALETLEGHVKVTSPYTENKQVVAGFTHVGNREEFKTDAKITCECFSRPVYTKATFSSKKEISSTFEMESPFRGYQTVKWNFNHAGKIDDFHTRAEYETNGKKISYENIFSLKDTIQGQFTILTPFANLSRTHVLFSHAGSFPNVKTHTEAALNDKMIESDFELSHNPETSMASAVITTPFVRYETMNAKLVKMGNLHALTVTADLKCDQPWHAFWSHTIDRQDIHSSAIIRSPFLEDEVSVSFNHTGTPLDFENIFEYTMGPLYRTTSQSKFNIYNLPNLTALAKSTTVIGEETRRSIISLDSSNDVSDDRRKVDLSTKFVAEIRQQKVNIDFGYIHTMTGDEVIDSFDLTTFAVVELPIADFDTSKLFYEINSSANKIDMSILNKQKLLFETPLLEPFSFTSLESFDGKVYKKSGETTYGEQKIITQEYFDFKTYNNSVKTPIEGYEEGSIVVNFNGNLWQQLWNKDSPNPFQNAVKNYKNLDTRYGTKTFGFDSTLTSTQLSNPIELAYNIEYTVKDYRMSEYKTKLIATYDIVKVISVEEMYTPGAAYSMKTLTPFDGYEETEVDINYMFDPAYKVGGDILVTSSALDMPIKAVVGSQYVSVKDMEFSSSFSSGFTNFTNIEVEVKSSVVKKSLKPVFKLSWEDSERNSQVLGIEGSWTTFDFMSENVDIGAGVTVQTPYDAFSGMSIQMEHKHSTSPIRAKELLLLKYNEKTYLDVDTEFGTQNKFTGAVNFRAPRNMEFSFSGENEGESVDGDFVLNWNKDEQKSNVRLQFGLADSGDRDREKKIFHLRFTQPTRIFSLHNSFEKTNDKIKSVGNVSWDDENGKEASYDMQYLENIVRGMTVHESSITIVVPARTVEMTGSFTDKESQKIGTGTLLWDAKTDRKKQVGVKVTVAPYNVKKMAQLDITLPSMNKELTLKTDMAVNEGPALLDGQLQIMYSPETKKTINLKYFIKEDGSDMPNYSAGWILNHVQTKTHLEMSSSLTRKDAVTSGDVQLQYLTNAGDMKTMMIQSNLDESTREVDIKLTTPEDTAEILAHLTDESPYIMTLKGTRNAKPVWRTVWKVDNVARTLDATLTYGDMKKQITTKAFFLNETSFVSETNRQSEGEIIQEGHMNSELKDRVLHGHLKWRPQLVQDILGFSAETLKQVTNEVSSVMEVGTKGLGNEMVYKYRTITASMSKELAPVTDTFDEEVQLIQRDLRAMRKELKNMYKHNGLYLRTLIEVYNGTIKQMLTGYTAAITKLKVAYVRVEESIEEITNKIDTYPFKQRYNNLVKQVTDKIQNGRVIVEEEIDMIFTKLTQKFDELSKVYNKAVDDISTEMKQYIIVLVDELALTPYIDDLKKAYEKLMEAYPDMDNLRDIDIHKTLNEVHQLFIDAMEESSMSDKYRTIYKRTKIILREKFGGLLDNKDVEDLYQAVLDLYEQVSWVYEYTEMNLSLRELINKLVTNAREKVIEEFNQLPLGILDLHKSTVTTFDLQNGEIEFDLYLPIPMENFERLMRFSAEKYVAKLKKMADKYFPRRDICFWDIYYKMAPVQLTMDRDWVPPFDTFGSVSGREHITTFDGSHFDIAGLCSYVLVEDVANKNFTIVQKSRGNAKNMVRDSLVIMVHGKTVEMFHDYMVKIDGQHQELPYNAGNLHIVRFGNRVLLETKIGLEIISDFSRDNHIVGLSGWYHGKVGGLLGTYDNEPHNDMMTPEGMVLTNAQKFMNSWEVSSLCRSKKNYATKAVPQKSEECAAVFEATASSLRPCFLQVLPDQYQHSCDMEPSRLCHIASLYVQTCASNGITVSIPQSCVKCAAHDQTEFLSNVTLQFDRKSSDSPLQNSMDVVFVVEEKHCNQQVANKLKDIIYEMEQTLTKKGMTDNRYGLVGFSGSEADSHTMEGQLFNDASKFAMGLENLQFSKQELYSDILGAVRYATTLAFRTGVTKTIILVSCSANRDIDGYNNNGLSDELRQRDITLHMLRQNAFRLKSNRSPKSQIYGIDHEQAFIGRTRGNEKDLFSEIDIPDDYFAKVALQTNGSIFDVSNMLAGGVRQQKAFRGMLGGRFAKINTSHECQTCTCELDMAGTPQSVCRRCDAKQLYVKHIRDVMATAVKYKNHLSQKIQAILY